MTTDLIQRVSDTHEVMCRAIAEFQKAVSDLQEFGGRVRSTADSISGEAVPYGAKRLAKNGLDEEPMILPKALLPNGKTMEKRNE